MAKRRDEREERSGRGQGGRKASTKSEDEAGAGRVVEWIKSILIAIALFLVLRTFIVQTFVITSGSMEDTLLVGDFLLVNRVAIGPRIPFTRARIPGYSSPKRGDVLVFKPPPPDDSTLNLVKRLVGMPGDTIEMRGRVVFIDGKALDEPYVKHTGEPDSPHDWMTWQRAYLAPGVDPSTYAPTRDNWGPLIIPEAHYMMLGDNRETSLDSRYWGLVEGWRLEGRAEFLYFSYNHESYRPFPWLREIRWGRLGQMIH